MRNLLIILIFLFFSKAHSQSIVSTEPENKKAIVEESTGIHCGYCPEGHAIINNSISQYPDQVFVIKYHYGTYAWDCDPNGGHDFENQFAIDLANQAYASGQPAASINRTVFGASGQTAISRGAWAQEITNIVQQPAYVNLGVEATISGSQLNVKVEAYYTDNSPADTNRLIIALTQDGTVGPQSGATYNPSFIVSDAPNTNYAHNEYDYLHMDRLVHMLTGINGEPLNNTSAGTFIERCYSYDIPSYYNDAIVDLEELKVTAYIAESNNDIINGAQTSALISTDEICQPNEYEIFISEINEPSGIVVLDEGENDVEITITNLSDEIIPANSITVWYNINDNYFSEIYPYSISSGASISHTFSETVNLSEIDGTFLVESGIESSYDTYLDNNSIQIEAEMYSYCVPSLNCTLGDGFQNFTFADINNDSGCEGYGDFIDISTDIAQGDTYSLSFTTGYGTQVIRAWIDYNDDLYFSMDELIVDQFIIAQGSGAGSFTATTETIIPENAPLGEHLLRIKSAWNQYVPDDPCEITNYGETEDYTINIVESLSLNDISISENITIFPNPSNGSFNVRVDEKALDYEIFNLIGQRILKGKFNVGENLINLKNRQDGIYILKLQADNGQKRSYKLIKNSKF